jgi:hypothetical protein
VVKNVNSISGISFMKRRSSILGDTEHTISKIRISCAFYHPGMMFLVFNRGIIFDIMISNTSGYYTGLANITWSGVG